MIAYDYYGNTKEQLYKRARKLGIEGRSKMNKEELAEAHRAQAALTAVSWRRPRILEVADSAQCTAGPGGAL